MVKTSMTNIITFVTYNTKLKCYEVGLSYFWLTLVINRIEHSCSCVIEFMKLVAARLAFYTCLINVIIHEDEYWILCRWDCQLFSENRFVSFHACVTASTQIISIYPLARIDAWQVKWAATCDFQQCGILTSVDLDEPVQPPLKLRTPNDVQSVA